MTTTTNVLDDARGNRQARRAEWGNTVRVDFMAWLEDGTLIASSIYSEPLIFTIGTQSVMRGLETLVSGMTVGESRTERMPADATFGPYRPELSCQVSRSWLETQGVAVRIGLGLAVRRKDDSLVHMRVTGMDADRVTLDANHRFAGKELIIQLDLLEILDEAGLRVQTSPTPPGS